MIAHYLDIHDRFMAHFIVRYSYVQSGASRIFTLGPTSCNKFDSAVQNHGGVGYYRDLAPPTKDL